jgi:hypothetical protein
MEQITALEFGAKAALERALKKPASAELRQRVTKLLDQMKEPVESNEWIRQWRGVVVLEQIGTIEVREHLEKLTRGAPGARLTAEAIAALERMDSTSTLK